MASVDEAPLARMADIIRTIHDRAAPAVPRPSVSEVTVARLVIARMVAIIIVEVHLHKTDIRNSYPHLDHHSDPEFQQLNQSTYLPGSRG